MTGTRFTEVRRFAELDSTNRYALDEARAGAPEGLVVMADHQTAGRGRLGRRWEAPAGANLLVSVLLRPTLAPERLQLCTLAMALAARSACAGATGFEPEIKWPNDLMAAERKLAGILAEVVADGPAGPDRAVVVGIGVNVGWPPPDTEQAAFAAPEGLGNATSLWRESGKRVGPRELLDLLLADLDDRLGDLAAGGGDKRLMADYRRACTTLGRDVTVSLPGETVTGSVLDVTDEGHLLVDLGLSIRTITAGDVVHVRA